MRDQTIILEELIDFDGLTFYVVLVLAALHAAPWNTKVRQLTYGDRCFLRKYSGDFLISTPVRTAYGIEKMHMRIITFSFDTIAE